VQPSIIFNMAAQSFVHTSFDQPKYTCDVDMYGFMYIMESLKKNDMTHVRVYQAGSSEQFGTTPPLQNEDSPMEPNSPYGIAKLAAHKFAKYYRNVGFWTTVGILFNHEEPGKRGQEFVTRKIAVWCAQARYALCHNTSVPKIRLGNMGAKRDWGRAYEYMEAAVRMMTELQEPVDLVIATGETHTVLEFFQEACKVAEIPESVAVASLEIDPMLVRQAEVPVLCGDASKAKRVLGWESKVKFPILVQQMVEVEIENAKNQK
jgi:GDPmannose 4,6-dehydratase